MMVCIYDAGAVGCCLTGRLHQGGALVAPPTLHALAAHARAAGCHAGPEGAAT